MSTKRRPLFRLRALKALGLALALVAAPAAWPSPDDADVQAGRALYLQGRLPDGSALRAARLGATVQGAAAACVQCHRRSGLGLVEGDQPIAPITGRALFGSARSVVTVMDPVRGKALNRSHEPYTEAEVAAAVREGRHPDGHAMNEMMPRYALDDGAMRSLVAYLRTLSVEWSPGADDDAVRFATVITPDVSPERRKAFLETLQAAFSQKNGSTLPGKRHMVMAAEFSLRTERRWDLDVWELTGAPQTWPAQLEARYRAAPVFAIVSGLGSDWTAVHGFCEAQAVPCWFPSVPVAPADDGAWSLYFSAGARLEAEVLALHLAQRQPRPRRVWQLVGASAGGRSAAEALAAELRAARLEVRSLAPAQWAALGSDVAPGDVLVGWLDATELGALAARQPPSVPTYWSASLGGADPAGLPAAWREDAHLVYPYQLPAQRGPNLAVFRAWVAQRGIAVVDELLQSEVYFAVSYLRDTMGDMLSNLYRDYLVERAENMLSLRESRKANEETLARQSIRLRYLHRVDTAQAEVQRAYRDGLRTGTTAYPALALGPGQRLASKGAYVLRLGRSADEAPTAETPWLVP